MKSCKKALSLLLAIVMLAAVLGGCQDGKSSGNNPPPNEEASPGASRFGGEIVVGIAQDLDDSLDPHRMTAAGTREVLFNVFEGLVKPDTDGNLIPAVAESYAISDTGDEFTFALRKDLKFHDGSSVTVGDVVYSISRAAGLDTGQPLVAALGIVSEVEALGSDKIVVRTSMPNIEFIAFISTASIIPEGSDPADGLIGTGPFQYVSRIAQENFVIEKFDGYWGEKAYLDKVTFRIIDNADALVMALKSGAIDFCAHMTEIQTSGLGDGFTILEGTMNLVQALYLNNDVAPFDDIRVRQAISYVIDPQEIMDFIADGRGSALGSSMYPAFSKYFLSDLTDYYAYDPDKAQQLLDAAGYGDGFSLTITVPGNYQPHVDTAVVIVDQLGRVGIKATIKTIEWESWIVDVYGAHEYEATVCGFDASTLTASALLSRFVSTNSKNISAFADPEYDQVYAEAAACTDEARQIDLYKRLQTILTEQAANAYIQDLCDLVAMRNGLDGYAFYPLYVLDLAKVYYTE
ncbi:MAG: ABC transporter substrate-binding protein [Clostridiales bacterium]|nr:ABC transporter substrate-binding protein [Clostridiales bacterium]